jgi:UDP-glucose:(heptosyl)LPS alpha-1,3-glucosyltransferase
VTTKPNKLRIAFIRQRYTPFGGAERFVNLAITSLEKHYEVDVTIIARSWNDDEKDRRTHFIKCDPFYIGRMWRDWSFYRAACKEAKRHKFDIIQSHERTTCGDIYRAGDGVHRGWLTQWKISLSPFRRFIITISPYHNFILKQEEKTFVSPSLQAIIANSLVIKKEIEQFFPGRHARVEVITNAVDTKKFTPDLKNEFRRTTRNELNIPDNAFVCLFVGSGYERKGLPLLLEIFDQLPTHVHLVAAGKDKTLRGLQSRIKNARIHLLGPQKNVRRLYGSADLFVFPSLYDPMPNSALEATASGLPVLASRTTGAADLSKNMGIKTLDPRDKGAWIQAITKHALSKTPIATTANNDFLSQEILADRLISLYQSILRHTKKN